MDIMALPFLPVNEVMSGAIGKSKAHVILVSELYLLSSIFCALINDCYSYHKDMKEGCTTNVIMELVETKKVSDKHEALAKVIEIANSIIKYMYQKIEKIKQENPNNPELHKVLDYTGMATVGWFFSHDTTPRYKATIWRLSLVEVEGMELEEWKTSQEEEKSDFLRHFLYRPDTKAKTLIEASSSLIKTRGHMVPQ